MKNSDGDSTFFEALQQYEESLTNDTTSVAFELILQELYEHLGEQAESFICISSWQMPLTKRIC